MAAGELGIARLAATQPSALGQQLGTGGAMNRAVDAPAAEQRRVGGVDDRINPQRGDVGAQRAQDGGHGVAGSTGKMLPPIRLRTLRRAGLWPQPGLL